MIIQVYNLIKDIVVMFIRFQINKRLLLLFEIPWVYVTSQILLLFACYFSNSNLLKLSWWFDEWKISNNILFN